jgi:RNA polymerase sigma-B factor
VKANRRTSDKWDKEKVRQLFVRYAHSHDTDIRDELVVMHMNLVKFIAAKFANRGEALDDLQQVGSLGLIKAIERYNLDLGAEFTTYATPTIIGEIKRYFRDKAWAFKVPRRLQELKVAVSRVTETLTNDLGRAPTIHEVADALKISDEEVLEAQELGQVYNLLSLNSEIESDEDKKVSNLLDYLGRADLQIENVESRVVLERAFSRLTGRERLVIYLRFYQGLSQSETAKILDISQMHVSRLQSKALQKLKDMLIESNIGDLLPG